MRAVVAIALAVMTFAGGLALAKALEPELPGDAARRAIAALPGVGDGWLDTLRRVAGPVQLDTVNAVERRDYQGSLLGLFEPWHGLVSINVRLVDYANFIRNGGGEHPLTVANPAGVVAHEFGHVLQYRIWKEYGEHYPDWANDTHEHFADRFSRAMLALRGWDTPDPKDEVLNHLVRYLLMRSYWPKE